MYSMKTAREANEAAKWYDKQARKEQLTRIAADIDTALHCGSTRIEWYSAASIYPETINTLRSLGYEIKENQGNIGIYWDNVE